MIVRPLLLAHLLHVVEGLRSEDAADVLSTWNRPGGIVAWANMAIGVPGHHFAVSGNDGEPIAAGGWAETGEPAVYMSWMIATERLHEVGIDLHRFCARTHERLAEQGARRFWTTNLSTRTHAINWLRRLGYRIESTAWGAGVHGESLVTLARGV